MSSKRVVAILAWTVLASLFASQYALGQLKLPFRSGQSSEPDHFQELTIKHGPWLIMCASFTGETAEQEARQLAAELRKNRLDSYIFRHTFDYSGTVNGIGWQQHTEKGQDLSPIKMKVANNPVIEEVAVLVGDFPSVDDSRAQKTLERIKTLMPESLKRNPDESGSGQRFRNLREYFKKVSKNEENKTKGPLGAAFMMTNPLLPDEYFKSDLVDGFIIKMNRNVKYSLLKCPGLYSVKVATFRGDSTFELKEIEKKQNEQRWLMKNGKSISDSKLAIAAKKANELTLELRKIGVEAYELHDRFESYVCIGSFEWISRKNGPSVEYNPEVVKLIEMFKADIEDLPRFPGAVRPKSWPELRKKGIVFDAQPVPVLVPRNNVRTASNQNGHWK